MAHVETRVEKSGEKGAKDGGPRHPIAHSIRKDLHPRRVSGYLRRARTGRAGHPTVAHTRAGERRDHARGCPRLRARTQAAHVGAEELVEAQRDTHKRVHQHVREAQAQVKERLHAQHLRDDELRVEHLLAVKSPAHRACGRARVRWQPPRSPPRLAPAARRASVSLSVARRQAAKACPA